MMREFWWECHRKLAWKTQLLRSCDGSLLDLKLWLQA